MRSEDRLLLAIRSADIRSFKARARDILAAMEGAPAKRVLENEYGSLEVRPVPGGLRLPLYFGADGLPLADAREVYRAIKARPGWPKPLEREIALAGIVYQWRRRGAQARRAA